MKNNLLGNPKLFQVEKILCYLVIFTGFFGVALLPLDIGSFKLFPHRVFYILLLCIFGIRILVAEKLDIFKSEVKWYLVFLAFWLGYSLLSLAWSISKVDAIKNIVFLFTGILLIFFICRYFQDKKELTRLYYLCFAAFSCLISIGIWELLTGSHLSSSMFFNYPPSGYMPTSTFYNQNDFASFLALYVPFGMGIFYYGRSVIPRLLGILSVFGAVYLIIKTNCLSALLAVIMEIVVLFVLYIIGKRKTYWLAILIPAVIAVVVWKYPLINQYILHMASVDERINLIRNGLHFLYSTFGFGVGAGNVEYWMANFAKYDIVVLNIHNWWAEVLVGYGVYVFIGYVLFYLGIIYKLVRVRFSTTCRFEKMFCDTLILSLCGFFFACIGPSRFLNITEQWYIFGIALAFINTVKFNEEKNEGSHMTDLVHWEELF